MNRKQSRNRRGIALLWTILTLLIMIGFVGFGTDVGWLVLSAQKLQTGADASALAAAQLVKVDQEAARQAALDLGALNDAAGDPIVLNLNTGNDPAGDIVIGRFDQENLTFTPQTTSPNAVKVVARRLAGGANGGVDLVFGRAFGVTTVNIERSAIAINGGGTGAGLIVLDPGAECALDFSGNPTVSVSGGSVQVNSEDDCAVCDNGNPELIAPTLNVAGGSCLESDTFEGVTNDDAPPVPDPLAELPEPPTGPTQISPPQAGPSSIQPGYYPNGIRKNSGSLLMAPGIYYVRQGFVVTSGDLTGLGVMIYVKTGPLDLGGNGNITLTPPNPVDHSFPGSDTYEHVTIFQARDNPTEAEIIGTNNMNIEGSIYFPNNPLRLGGTGDGIGNQLIVWQLEVFGTGDVTINYTGINPAPGNRVFLVE